MNTKSVRLANIEDAQEILNIYEYYVTETVITFEYEKPSLKEFKIRMQKILADYPFIVCIVNQNIIGYAYAHRHMERDAYQWNAELSVYLDQNYLHGGGGKLLYKTLIEILQLQNIRNVYGCVTSANKNSIKFHEHFGFKKLGIFHNTGYKCGKWHDVTWFEKKIAEYVFEPIPFLSISDIDNRLIENILINTSEKTRC
jgi:phosphinothricin acetyltransferase